MVGLQIIELFRLEKAFLHAITDMTAWTASARRGTVGCC